MKFERASIFPLLIQPLSVKNSIWAGISTIVVTVIIVVIVVLSSFGAYFVMNNNNSSSGSGQSLYTLTFNQIPLCQSPGVSLHDQIFIPWYVTLSNGINNTTKIQPANSSMPNPNNGVGGTYNKTNATITFLVPNGRYKYTLGPPNYYFVNRTSSSGTVIINGNNETVYFMIRLASCGSSVTTVTTNTTGIAT
ncbi:MAG: hypothetical protein ACYCQJ_03630 [Nitrososphaerales archaeon]